EGPVRLGDSPVAVVADSVGNVFVTGSSRGSAGNFDYLTLAYSATGVPLWTNRFNGFVNADDEANAMTLDSNGDVFVTGESVGFGTNYEYLTVAYSNTGVPLWVNFYGHPGFGDDRARAIAVDTRGNVFVTGTSWNGTNYDYATVAYSNGGLPLWTNRYQGQ